MEDKRRISRLGITKGPLQNISLYHRNNSRPHWQMASLPRKTLRVLHGLQSQDQTQGIQTRTYQEFLFCTRGQGGSQIHY